MLQTIFLTEILIKFRTGVKIDGKLSYDPKVVARHYAKSMLIPDLLAAFPNNLMVGGMKLFRPENDQDVILRLVRLLKIIRILQVCASSQTEAHRANSTSVSPHLVCVCHLRSAFAVASMSPPHPIPPVATPVRSSPNASMC